METFDVVGVILAGGRSSRMGGGDKCLIELDGRPLLAHAIERLQPQVTRLILNANGDPSRFAAFGLPVVPDRDKGFKGPLAGILAGTGWARANVPQARFIATVAGDTPLFPRDLVAKLRRSLPDETRIAVARSNGREHPVFGLFPLDFDSNLAGFLEESPTLSVHDWICRHAWAAVDFEPARAGALDPFVNINTPADLAIVQSKIGMEKPG